MAVDFSPLLNNQFNALEVLQSYGKAQTQKLEGLKLQSQMTQQRRRDEALPRIQQQVAAKNYTGAQADAAAVGDYDYAKVIGDIGKGDRDATAATADTIGSIAMQLRRAPADQRPALLQQMTPALAARGITPDQLAAIDTSDASLDGWTAGALTVKEQLAAQPKPTAAMQNLEAAGIGPDDPRYQEALLGNVNPSQYMAFGDNLIQTRGPGAGAATGGTPAPQGGVGGPQIEQLALATVPGARVTSGTRTPEHNREVGGAPNSYHLTGQARDLVPPQGMTMGQFEQTLRPTLEAQGLRVINEGDHLHVQPNSRGGGGSAAGGPRVVMTKPAAAAGEGYRLLSPQEAQAQGLDPNVRYQQSGKGQITALGGQSRAQLKPPPVKAVSDVTDSRSIIRQVDQALAALKARPKSIGPGTGMLGDTYTQLNDPGGTTTRAVLGKIAGQVIHDVSGAAVTLSEEPRFKPYVPTVTDTPEVARQKLLQMRRVAAGQEADAMNYYSEENGYRPMNFGRRPPAVSRSSLPQGWKVKVVN